MRRSRTLVIGSLIAAAGIALAIFLLRARGSTRPEAPAPGPRPSAESKAEAAPHPNAPTPVATAPFAGAAASAGSKPPGTGPTPPAPSARAEPDRGSLFDREPAILRATLVDPLGAPLPKRFVSFKVELASGEESFDLQTTDDDGVFVWTIGDLSALVKPVRRVRYAVAKEGADALETVVELGRPLSSGFNELGRVMLRPPPLLASGVLVDEVGAPYPMAAIELLLPVAGYGTSGAEASAAGGSKEGLAAAGAPGESRVASGAAGAERPGGLETTGAAEGSATPEARAPGTESFEAPWPPIRAATDAEGRFALRSSLDVKRLALRPRSAEALPGPSVAVNRGATEVRLVLPRGGAIVGRVLLDDPAAAGDVEVRALRRSPNGDEAPIANGAIAADGSFRLPGLSAGDTNVEVLARQQVRHRVEGVLVVVQKDAKDPRLAAIDLRSGARTLDLVVVDPDGKPVGGAKVVAGKDGAPLREDQTGQDGRVRLVVPSLPVDVLVSHAEFFGPAYRPTLVRNVAAETRITLELGLTVSTELTGLPSLPEDLRVKPWLHPQDVPPPAGAPARPREPSFGGPLESYSAQKPGAPFTVPAPGTYKVYVDVQRADGRLVTIPGVPPTITVLDQTTPQGFRLAVDAAQLDSAIRNLRDG